MGPTSSSLAAVLLGAALLLPLVLAGIVWRLRRTERMRVKLLTAVGVVASVVAAQLSIVGAAAVMGNRALSLYPTWSDVRALLTDAPDEILPNPVPPPITPAQLSQIATQGWALNRFQPAKGDGQYRLYLAPEPRSKQKHPVIVWLPPGYEKAKSFAGLKVVYLYNAAYGSVDWFVNAMHPADSAASVVRSKQVPPFVIVAPEINIDAPIDTECVDYPRGGPQAYTWLSRDVPEWAQKTLGVKTEAATASAMGWSVGAYCAAKLHIGEPNRFGAAASVQGYFTVEADRTSGTLTSDLAHDPKLRMHSDVGQLYSQVMRTASPHLVVVTSQADSQSYPSSKKFLDGHRDPGIFGVTYVQSGHSVPAWRAIQPELWRFLVNRTPWPANLKTPDRP